MATHSSILAWRMPWTEEPGRLHSPCGHKESDMTEQPNKFFLFVFCSQNALSSDSNYTACHLSEPRMPLNLPDFILPSGT